METCSRVAGLKQISFNSILSCSSDLNGKEHGVAHLPVSGLREVICPEPRNVTRVPSIVDSLNRCRNTKRNSRYHNSDPNLDVINLLSGMDDLEDELDVNSSHMALFSCSPPARTNNPLVHDVQFTCQTTIISSPTRNTKGRKPSSGRLEDSSHDNSASEKPMRRIVGFNNGGSKSHCISAFA